MQEMRGPRPMSRYNANVLIFALLGVAASPATLLVAGLLPTYVDRVSMFALVAVIVFLAGVVQGIKEVRRDDTDPDR
jgi:hypothetical protein